MSFKKAQDMELNPREWKNGWVNEAKYAYPRNLQNKQKYNLTASKPKGGDTLNKYQDENKFSK